MLEKEGKKGKEKSSFRDAYDGKSLPLKSSKSETILSLHFRLIAAMNYVVIDASFYSSITSPSPC